MSGNGNTEELNMPYTDMHRQWWFIRTVDRSSVIKSGSWRQWSFTPLSFNETKCACDCLCVCGTWNCETITFSHLLAHLALHTYLSHSSKSLCPFIFITIPPSICIQSPSSLFSLIQLCVSAKHSGTASGSLPLSQLDLTRLKQGDVLDVGLELIGLIASRANDPLSFSAEFNNTFMFDFNSYGNYMIHNCMAGN